LFPAYSSTIEDTLNQVSATNIFIQIIYITCFLQEVYINRKKTDSFSTEVNLDIRKWNFVMLFEMLIAIVGMNAWYFQRVLLYFQMFIVLLFPELSILKNKYRQISIAIVYVASTVLFVYRITRNLGGIMPYVFFWV
jgi:hypothetical protein